MSNDKQFAKYVVPSVLSFLLAGVYCFVDAFFVGNSVGDCGIAAINIAFSLLSVTVAVGFGLGVGASVLYSIKKDTYYIRVSYILMGIFSLAVSVPIIFFPYQLMRILGATDLIAKTGQSYMRIFAYASIIQVVSNGISPVLRNYGAPNTAMTAMISGLVSNIFLDWLFVIKLCLGMKGAAWASVIAQAISLTISIIFMPKHDKYEKKTIFSAQRQRKF